MAFLLEFNEGVEIREILKLADFSNVLQTTGNRNSHEMKIFP